MTFAIRFLALLALLVATTPAQAGFIQYTFTSDTADLQGSLTGSFRVDEADLADGFLTGSEVQNYLFTYTDAVGGVTHYSLDDIAPDLAVDPATGIPLAGFGLVLGDQVGDPGVVLTDLTDAALAPNSSFWLAVVLPSGVTDTGLGHWTIAPAGANPVPAPAGVVLGLVGVGCIVVARWTRHRTA